MGSSEICKVSVAPTETVCPQWSDALPLLIVGKLKVFSSLCQSQCFDNKQHNIYK